MPHSIKAALKRIDWHQQNIRLRKVLTSSLIAPLIVIIGPAVDLATAPAANAAGTGISFWFNNFTSIPAARTNITTSTSGYCRTETSGINYTWGTGSPTNCAAEKFAAYGLGRISAQSSTNKTYQFCIEADDGVIVEIAGTAVIDDWNDQGAISCTSGSGNAATNGTFTFAANTTYEIKVWYYENGGGADLRLYWRENSTGSYSIVDNRFLATSDSLLKPSISLPSSIVTYDFGNTTYNFGPGAGVNYLVSGGTTPYTYSLAPGSASLPTILTLNTSTGSIVYNAGGSQTKSTTTGLKIRVTDTYGMFADSNEFSVTVNPVIPATYPVSATSTIGGFTFSIQNFDSTLTYTGTTSVGGGSVSVNGTSGLVTVTGLGVGVSSTVTLTAAKSGEQSKSSTSPSYSSTPKITLTTPGSLSATATPNIAKSFSVMWSDVSNESSYRLTVLEGSTTRATIPLSANSTSRTITTSDFSGMQDGTQYTINLVAVGDGSQYDSSTAASTTITSNQTARTATFGTATRQSLGFTVPISNYDNTFTYETATASAGSASLVGSNIVVTGLTRGAGATVTISTRKSGFISTTSTSGLYYALETATAFSLTAKTMTVGAPYKILYSADASNPNKPTYTSTSPGVCTVSGETITPVTAGSCLISATLVGYSTYDTTTATQSYTVNTAPSLSTTTIADRRYGNAATTYQVITSNGVAPYSYTILRKTTGEVISGLTIDSSGLITFGQYLGAGIDTATVTVRDANGAQSTRDYSFTVLKKSPTFTVTADGDTTTTLSKSLSFIITNSDYALTGTVSLSLSGSSNLTGCQNLDISSGTASCTWITDQFTTLDYIYLSYSGNTNYYSRGSAPTFAEITYGTGPLVTVNRVPYVVYGQQTFTYGTTNTFKPNPLLYGTGPRSSWTWDIVRASDSQTVSGITNNGETITVSSSLPIGTYNMVVRVTDAKLVTSHSAFTITISKGNPVFSLSIESASVTVGKSTRITVTSSSPGVTGTFALYQGLSTNVIAGCDSITLTNSTGSCLATSSSAYGPAAVYYQYAGDTNYNSTSKLTSSQNIQFFPRTVMSYSTLTTTFGTAATLAGTYSARGGGAANLWNWSILKRSDSSTVSGISMNGETITVSNTIPAGTYLMTIVTTDGLGDTTYTNVTVTVNSLTGLTPAFGAVTRTANGFTTFVSNYDANYGFVATVSGGTVESGTATGLNLPLTVTGLGDSASATITVTTSRLNYTSPTGTVTGTSLGAGLTPSFGAVTKTATGYTVTISNYSASYTWTESVTAGTVSAGVPSGSNRTYTVTGLSPGQSATLYVTDTSTTTKSVTGFILGTAKASQSAVSVTTISGTYPSETLTATGGSGTGTISFSLAGPATTSVGTTKISSTVTAGAYSLYSPDGSMLYILNGKSPRSDLLRFNVSSGTFSSAITLPANSMQMAIAPSGNYILVASSTQITKISTSTGETSTILTNNLANFVGISIDPTGSDDFYISDSSGRKVFGYQANGTSKFSTTVSTNTSNVATSFGRSGITGDGTKFYVIGTGTDSTLYEFNTSTGAKSNEVFVNSVSGLASLAITPNGNYAFAGHSSNGRMYGIDLRDSTKNSATVLFSNYNVNQVSVTPDSAYVYASVSEALSGYTTIKRYETASFVEGNTNSTVQHSTNVFGTPASTAIAPDSKSGYFIYTSGIVPVTLAWGAGSAYCSVNGTTISAKSAGTCNVIASKAADADFLVESSTATTFTFGAVPALRVTSVAGNVNYSPTSQYSERVSISGFVGSDTATISSVVYNYLGINGTTYANSTTKPTAVGTYSVTPTGGALSFTSGFRAGYVVPNTYVSDTLTVLATVSDSVTAVSAVATSSTAATVTFTAPAANRQGGSAVTLYSVSNGTDTVTASASSSPINVTGLSPGTAYVFRVNAINSVGRSETATAASITMPLGVTISPSSTTAIFGVSITAIVPTVRGGSSITYQVTPTLPAGLVLNVNGSITGTPTETSTVKTYTETATATGTFGTATFTLSVSKATSAITVPTITPIAPVLGEAITFTSTVTSNTQATLTGTISFKNASNVELCSTSILSAGVGSCNYTPITTDTFTVRAFYSGMTYVDTSTSLSALTVVPTKGNPTVSLAASPENVVLGTSTSLTTTISTGTATNATGQVAYTINSTAISGCSAVNVASNSATCSFTPTTSGIYVVLATYVGDANFNGVVAATKTITVSSCTQSQTGLTFGTGAPAAGYCAVRITEASSGSLGLPVGVIEMKSRVMIIGGGGAGGPRHGGGGGAGSLLYSDAFTITETRTVTIGAGGTASYFNNNSGGSTTFGTAIAAGGGSGGGQNSGAGFVGGSGGGGSATNNGATGTQTSYSGFTSYVGNGGKGTGGSLQSNYSGGGGGGAGGNGENAVGASPVPGKGGNGRIYNMTLDGSNACFAAGGAGGSYSGDPVGIGGGCSGLVTATVGGAGNAYAQTAGSGVANTGSGGGGGGFEGGSNYLTGAGGSGLVALRYISPAVITVPADTTTASLTTVTFVATAPQFGNLFTRTYQWQKWNTELVRWDDDTSTATSTTLTYIFIATFGNVSSQRIRLVVTDTDGTLLTKSASRTITLTVTPLVQPTLAVASTYGFAGSPLKLFTTGGAGTGTVSYTYVSSGSTAGCSLSAGSVSLATSGICKVIATKSGDKDYLVKVSDTATVSFVAFQMTVQVAPTNPNTGIFTAGSTTTSKGSDACTSGCIPTVTSISVTTAVAGQALSITITGTNFTGATKVTFNATIQATSFTVNSDTQIAATMPATVPAGEVGIDVTGPGGISGRNYDLELTS